MTTQDITRSSAVSIDNEMALITIDLFGGAIIDFRLRDSAINPLSFRFAKDAMPENNKSGAPYQGHFLCLGRWGEPSAGEKKAGIPDHGHFANMWWTCRSVGARVLKMRAESHLEGLEVTRTMQIDERLPLYSVKEKVKNINPLGRLYNMVQHPTLAGSFLNHRTKVQCNASNGFHYKHYRELENYASRWPFGINENKRATDLRSFSKGEPSVFCFVVRERSRLAWITAHSPDARLLIGYLWIRRDYPWINIWKQWDKNLIKYCGLEFGTTGIHQPFNEILSQGKSEIFNEKTLQYIDAGDAISRKYLSFLVETPNPIGEIESVYVQDDALFIKHGENQLLKELHSPLIGDLHKEPS